MKTFLSLFLLINSFVIYSNKGTYRNLGPRIFDLEMGTYKSKHRPGETIYYNSEAGRFWSVEFVTWLKNGVKKEYTLPLNQFNGLGNSERLILDKKNGNIFRLEKNSKILLIKTSEKSFKTEDGSEWKLVSNYILDAD
jgi:hypothetical protein